MRAVWFGLLVACSSTGVDGTEPPPVEVTDLAWRAHEGVGAFAWASWEQSRSATVRVEYQLDGRWSATPEIQGAKGSNERLVAGIPYGSLADWRVVTADGVVEAIDPIETAPAPEGLPTGRLSGAVPGEWWSEGRYLLTSISETGGGWGTSGPFWTVIFDRSGRPVWARRNARQGQWTLYATVARSADHLIVDEFSMFGGDDAVAIRMHLDQTLEEIPIPGFHHAFVELPDGSLVWGSREHGGGEALVQREPGAKHETVLWTCQDDWPEAIRGCISNCIFYDDDRDSFLYSFYTNETVVEVDRQTGSTLWWAGDVPGGYRFTPPGSQFAWQHGVSWTDDGTLLVSTHDPRDPRPTNYAREYRVDHDARTLTPVWSYDALAYADTNGDTWRLPNGNTLHTLGSASLVKEVDVEGEVVWFLDFNADHSDRLMGRSQWIADLYPLLAP